jgi:integrase
MTKRIAAWLSWLEDDRQLAPTTCKLYERTILRLERDFLGLCPLEKLTASDLRSWLHDRGGSTSSYGNRVAALKSFFGFLLMKGHIREDPANSLDVPKRGPSTREPVTDLMEKLRLLDELDARKDRRVGESRDMARFLAETGMRISDACGLSLKPPTPPEISIPRRRRPDAIFKINDEARAAMDRLGGRFGIGARALQRRFEMAGFHPEQLRHWHRINRENRELRDERLENFADVRAVHDRRDVDAASPMGSGNGNGISSDALQSMGRLLKNAEDAAAVLVRDALRQGRSWSEIASALSLSERAAKQRYAR